MAGRSLWLRVWCITIAMSAVLGGGAAPFVTVRHGRVPFSDPRMTPLPQLGRPPAAEKRTTGTYVGSGGRQRQREPSGPL